MKTPFVMVLSLATGAALGVCTIQALHAQAKPPVYSVALIEVTNPDGYAKEYLPPASSSIAAHGGVYVARGSGTAIAGTVPKDRVVILRWESLDALKAWYNSADYVAANKIGEKYAKFNFVAVEGVPQ
jgi:uncharacterized protein (DUF1330 family)